MNTDTKPARTPLQKVRIAIWLLVGLAAIGFAILLATRGNGPGSTAQSSRLDFMVGGPFTLTGADGNPFSSTALAGKPYALFFGFTHCPDVCPATLARLANLRQRLGGGADSFNIVFVTVDPERDTPAEMRAYTQMFDTPVIALTGSPAQVQQVVKQHAAYAAKAPDNDAPDGYTMDHTAAVLLFDRKGEFQSTIALEEQDAPALDKLKRLTA
ncbi:SCO family protein [Sphingomonas sp. GCM10030256]|uniref:SCO family protein n=1 Tax=Sphingomonas sp. GCM10030256 TaxID=3273427 RepID=UPI00361DB8FF